MKIPRNREKKKKNNNSKGKLKANASYRKKKMSETEKFLARKFPNVPKGEIKKWSQKFIIAAIKER